MSEQYTRDEVAKNNNEESLWCIIDSKVYDLTDFLDAHPGGETVLLQVAGTDATTAFYNLHRHEVLQKYDKTLRIGTVKGEKSKVVEREIGGLNPVPYAEPMWLTPQFSSPYFTDSHKRLQKEMRLFVDKYVAPEAQEAEQEGKYISQELVDRQAETNILAMRLGPGKHLQGRNLLNNSVKPEEFNYFHEMIIVQEMIRQSARGFQDGNMAGMVIGLPAVMNYCKAPELRSRVIDEVLSGKKRLSLAITEAFGGSDVAGLRTVAEKTPDGKHYIISGTKKWITNGTWSDDFVTGVRTSEKGLSMMLIPRGEGVETTSIKTSYSPAAATAYIKFDKVKVPVDHLLGEENKGLQVILSNFNHERWMMVCATVQMNRIVLDECLKWSNQRLVFGKKLIEQPVIRQKLARMISRVEADQAWLEAITYQMTNMSYADQSKNLAGPIGLLKFTATRSAHDIADEAVQIFGGRALTKTGMGKIVEMWQRTYKFDAILGGSEEILADLGVRQAMKHFPNAML